MTQFDNNLTLGQLLRQEREKRGISLEQVASATKVGVKQLHSLEEDQFADLPAKPFIRGFVTAYCRFIGIDHKEILTHFNSFIDSKAGERPNREAGHSGYAFEKREGTDQSRLILGIVMGSFIVLAGVAMLLLKPTLHGHKHSHLDKLRAAHSESPTPDSSALAGVAVSPSPGMSPDVLVSPVVPSPSVSVVAAVASPTPAPAPAPSPTPSPTPTASPRPSPKPSGKPSPKPSPSPQPIDPLNSGVGLKSAEIKEKVVVKAVESIWVRYKVDDKETMEFPLRKGRILVLRARQSMVIQVSQPSDSEINLNGDGFKLAGTLDPVLRHNDPTFFFPRELAETIEDPFPGRGALSGKKVPSSSKASRDQSDN